MTFDSSEDGSIPQAGEDAGVAAAFERFQRSGGIAPHGVRSVIDESWRRCFRAGIDPTPQRAPRRGAAAGVEFCGAKRGRACAGFPQGR